MPSLSIDCVVFGFNGDQLKILLVQMKERNSWSLPGGYVGKDEDLEKAAVRILKERTGAQDVFLNQFRTFGKVNRSEDFFKDYPYDLWFKSRFISVAFYALVDFSKIMPLPDHFSAASEWKDIANLPPLAMDHDKIFNEGLLHLRRDLNYKPVGINLLPEKFTMPDLQRLYETILGKKLNRGNFYRKMKAYDILERLNETRRGGAHKAPLLYSFNAKKYEKALEEGLQNAW